MNSKLQIHYFKILLAMCIAGSSQLTQAASPGLVATNTIINGSFEDGNLDGWTVSLSGTVTVDRFRNEEYEYWIPYPHSNDTLPGLANNALFLPNSGTNGTGSSHLYLDMAYGGFLNTTEWTLDDGWTYQLVGVAGANLLLQQTVHLSAGSTIEGWGNYTTRCSDTPVDEGLNQAWVRIDDSSNGSTTVWHRDPETVGVGNPRSTGWESWRFAAAIEGDYTLTLQVTEGCQDGGHVEFDGIHAAPEPSSLSFLGLAVLLTFYRSRIPRGDRSIALADLRRPPPA